MSQQVYTLKALKEAVVHVLGSTPSALNQAPFIVNRALTSMTNAHQWRWREKPISVNIPQTALPNYATTSGWTYNPYNNPAVTGPSAWDNGTGTGSPIYRDGNGVTWVYSPNHGLQPGLLVNVQGVTQAASDDYVFNGPVVVVATPDVNTFTYANSGFQDLNPIANSGGSPNYPYGIWVPGQVTLPSDFASMKSLACPTLSIRQVQFCSVDDIYRYRQYLLGTTQQIFVCVSSIPQGSLGQPSQDILYVFPTPNQQQPDFLQGVYIRMPPALVNPTDVADIPPRFQELLYFTARYTACMSEGSPRAAMEKAMMDEEMMKLKNADGVDQEPAGFLRQSVHQAGAADFNFFGYRTIGTN